RGLRSSNKNSWLFPTAATTIRSMPCCCCSTGSLTTRATLARSWWRRSSLPALAWAYCRWGRNGRVATDAIGALRHDRGAGHDFRYSDEKPSLFGSPLGQPTDLLFLRKFAVRPCEFPVPSCQGTSPQVTEVLGRNRIANHQIWTKCERIAANFPVSCAV